MSQQTVDFIQDIISGIDFTFNVISSSDDGTDTTLVVKKTFHSRFQSVINDTVSDFKILSVNQTTRTIIVSGLIDVTKPMTLNSPFYFYGTVFSTGVELDLIEKTRDKCPFIYLYQVTREEIDNEPGSVIDRTPTLRFFFLDLYDKKNAWLTNEHYDKVIIPMSNLIQEFVGALNNSPRVGEFDNYATVNRANFSDNRPASGRENALDGEQDNSVFNMPLSGVQLDISFPLFIDLSCQDSC